MPLRGSYSSITRQLDELERRASRLTGPGCAVCWGWPELAVAYGPGVAEAHAPRSPWDDGGDRLPEWPPGLTCPACQRTPRLTIRVEYEARPPGGPDTPARRPLPSPYAPEGRVYDSEP